MFQPSQAALDAVRAAKNYHIWGEYATVRFVEKRGIDTLFTVALCHEWCK